MICALIYCHFVPLVQKKTYLSELSSKYSEKPWSETFQLVHRCMVGKNFSLMLLHEY